MRGNLFVVVAPSGAGKTSLVAKLLEREKNVKVSISYTTRAPRAGEENGRDYHFIDRATFEKMIAADEFLEYADVYGNYYGTTGYYPYSCGNVYQLTPAGVYKNLHTFSGTDCGTEMFLVFGRIS